MSTYVTKFHGPTNHKPGRVSVRGYSCAHHREIVRMYSVHSFDIPIAGSSYRDVHDQAIVMFCIEQRTLAKMPEHAESYKYIMDRITGERRFVRGSLDGDRGYYYVETDTPVLTAT